MLRKHWICDELTPLGDDVAPMLRGRLELEQSTIVVSRHSQSMPESNIKRACITAAVLFPVAAYGSFGGAPCRDDFACHFLTWGVLVGAVGVPISGLIFAVLHLGFCNRARSRLRQFFLGSVIGMVAYEISAAGGALIAASGKAAPGQQTNCLLIGFVSTYVVLAIAAVLYARSRPKAPTG